MERTFLSEASTIVCFYLCVLLTAATLNRKTPVPLCDTFHTDTHTRPLKTSGGFCPVIWHIFDVESKKTKWESEEGAGREREQSRLSTPVKGTLCWALLCNPPFNPPLPPYPPFIPLPSKARVDFSLNAIRNVTGPIHGQMESWLCGWRPIPLLENDRNLGCRWRSGWMNWEDFRGSDRDGKMYFSQGFLCV